jgi:hypothetical protein
VRVSDMRGGKNRAGLRDGTGISPCISLPLGSPSPHHFLLISFSFSSAFLSLESLMRLFVMRSYLKGGGETAKVSREGRRKKLKGEGLCHTSCACLVDESSRMA